VTTDTRSIIIDESGERAHRRSNHLPERLTPLAQATLAAFELATLLFVSLIALSESGNAFAAAFVTAAIVCLIAWQTGLYARSYAVHPIDEAYYACASVALAAIPVIFMLNIVAGVPIGLVLAALTLSAFASSVVRIRLHLERRTGALSATLRSISPHGWSERENPRYRIAKRTFDLTIASLMFIPVGLIMLIAAIAILIDSGLPVFFRQQRIGENGLPFTILKFRTMTHDADSGWVKPRDKRVTRAGHVLRRFSLDELPQLFNVLRGDMSIVGPRPEMTQFARGFTESVPNYAQRHVVTPGITGWAQLYFKRDLSPSDIADVLPYDLFYVENASIIMDCGLILKTIVELFVHRPE
jgi:lipopolysaccharide/colanic/teichoic acid biosynthesis glycosyltransferase